MTIQNSKISQLQFQCFLSDWPWKWWCRKVMDASNYCNNRILL